MTTAGAGRGPGRLIAGVVLAFLVARPSPEKTGWFIAGAWLAFAAGAYLVLRSPIRVAVPLIVVGGLALPLAAGLEPPRSSDDLYRYVWDGRVQAAGIDPYRYVPAAPELVGLRDGPLWPDGSHWCVAPGAIDADTGRPLVPGCTVINRPTVHTIYPPVAEAFFLAVHRVARGAARPPCR